MRVVSGCLVAVVTGLFGGLIMGEYQLRGAMAIFAGVLFGLAIAEVAIATGKSRDWPLVATSAVSAFVGMTWAAFIEAGDSFGRVAGMRWVGSLLALAAAGWWVRSFGTRGPSSPPDAESA